MLGVEKLVPVPNDAPPLAAAYQFNTPEAAVAPIAILPVPHKEPGVVAEMVGKGVTVIATTVE